MPPSRSIPERNFSLTEGDAWTRIGVDLPEALATFRENYRLVLLDAAAIAARFEDFREEILRFFEETWEVTATEWEEAVREVREGRADVDGLPRVAADRRVAMTIDLVDRPSTTLPVLDEQTSIAA